MKITACRACDGAELEPVLDLGEMPLANALLTSPDAEEERYPLELVRCTKCSLLQITETVDPAKLFGDYPYFSSYADTMVASARELAARAVAALQLDERSLVVELASNDGYLLQHYRRLGVPVLGIEPAKNVARVAEYERRVPTLVKFFTKDLADRLASQGLEADVIHANNVLAHVADVRGFVAGIERLLRRHGAAIVEVPHALQMIDNTEFDTIYHEHLAYFSMTALVALLARAGLVARDVEEIPIHGGSLRVWIGKKGSVRQGLRVDALLAREAAWGVHERAPYTAFAERVAHLAGDLKGQLERLRADKHKVAAYGASAKGAVLLNHLKIGRELVDFVVDRSEHKQGRFVPGVRIPIERPEKLLEAMPEDCLLLAWNLENEVLAQQAEYRRRGGRFLVPIPKPRLAA